MSEQTIVASFALLVSVLALGLTIWTAFLQRKHMRLSVRPIAAIPLADFENRIGVFLQNKGLGPMRIVSLRVSNPDGETCDQIKPLMPKLNNGIFWSNFHDTIDGGVIEAGKNVELLLLQGNMQDEGYKASRDRVRQKLSVLKIEVVYEDLYGKKMEPYNKKLSFFGRHFKKIDAQNM